MTGAARRWGPTALLWAAGIGMLVALWAAGAEYYRMSLAGDDGRFLLAEYPVLKAAGSRGHALGIAGTALILVNLAYLVRRHVPAFHRAGPLRLWMTAHVLTGLFGSALIALHAGFHAGNVVHLAAAASLALVVATGVVGRFVYALVPHDVRGAEVPPGDLARHLIEQGERDPATIKAHLRRAMRLRRVLSGWRDLHRPVAAVMATAATAHIAVALASRGRWMAETPMAVHIATFATAGVVLALFAVAEVVLVRRRRMRERMDLDALVRSELRNANAPPSLHPVVDLTVCMGSAACVASCPEGDVLGIVNGHATLVHGSHCVGHGRCAAECPTGAITLVFGSSRRGVDIPVLSPYFETNVPGIFITGELGGMGLIQNAVKQSLQAVDYIVKHRPRGGDGVLDLVVVGAGPAGMAAALQARRKGLTFDLLDQEPDAPGGSINHYPRRKVVLTAPFDLPGWGRFEGRSLTKERLIEMWTEALSAASITVCAGERVQDIRRRGEGPPQTFEVESSKKTRLARTVLLCVGRRGSPRRLEVPGEDLPKVAYRVLEPEQYAGSRVLVVGGGDSAVESALGIAAAGATSVVLCHRRSAVSPARADNRDAFDQAVAQGRVRFEGETQVTRIAEGFVTLRRGESTFDLPNDFVIVQIGGVLPLDLLARIGVAVERKFGTR